jgi:uncharacterized delta-60 repeat protein
LDAGFNPGTGANDDITGVGAVILTTAIQSDGKIIIGGFFTSYNGTVRNYIARVNTNGSLEVGFNTGTGSDGIIYTTALQTDGKIIIGGAFTSFNGTLINRIARLNTDGSLDAGFNPGTGANSTIYTTALQSDGKIVIGGFFTSYNGTLINRIARLNTDGSLDAGFNPGTGANNQELLRTSILTTAIQGDGKIIIGGDFTSYNGTAINGIARLNTDGSLDETFNRGTGPGPNFFANNPFTIQTTAIQSDGKIIIGGMFTTYNEIARNRIARLNTDGSLDAGFSAGRGANNGIYTTALQSDGKIIIGGDFTSYDGTAINRFARVNTDGSLDAGFNPGTGANSTIYATTIQSDGKIIISGAFTSFNETGRNRIARLMNCASSCTPPTFLNDGTIVKDANCGSSDGALYIVPTSGTAPFWYSKDGGTTYVAGPNNLYGFANLSAGTYKLRLKDANGCESDVVEKTVSSNCPTTCTPPTFLNDGTIVANTACGKSEGAIYLVPLSGTAPFQYSIDGGTTYVSGPATLYGFANLAAGTYQLRIKDANGCESAVIERVVSALDCPTTCTTPPTLLNNGMIVGHATCGVSDGALYLIPTSGTAPFRYSINGGTTYVSGPDAGTSFSGLAAGVYQLRIKDATGCVSAVVQKEVLALYGTCATTSNSGKTSQLLGETNSTMLVYPNPSSGMFRLQLQHTTGKVQVTVLNSQGAVVEQRNMNVSESGTLNFDLSTKAKGLYLIRVVSDKDVQTAKVLVQ